MIHWFYPSLILRISGAAVVSFLIVLLLGPKTIRWLLKRKFGDRPEFEHESLNELTRNKSDTPTMGGALICLSVFASVILFADLSNTYIRMGMFTMFWLSALGAVDDWLKLRRARDGGGRDGLKSHEKILFQIGLAVLVAVFMRDYAMKTESGIVNQIRQQYEQKRSQAETQKERDQLAEEESRALANAKPPAGMFYLPFKANPIALPALAYIIITVLTMVGSSNAVNLTDGMDGLAAGCMVIVTAVFLILSWVVGNWAWARLFHMPQVADAAEMTVLCASIMGACLGFLWFNCHPAQVFMGDTGSLSLGGLLGYIAVVTRQELLLVLAGGVFVMEALSVILQVNYFKLTRPKPGAPGKRLFKCAPIHHHFHLSGWAEPRVVVRAWLLCVIFAALALATLKLR